MFRIARLGWLLKNYTLASLSLAGALAQPGELPVRHVVLYKHGVGFFERSGKLAAGEAARLDFRAAEMNDVLKSLTILEAGGGRISGLRYDSADPLSHKLEDFPFRIGSAQPLSGIFDQLKGAQIELQFGNDLTAGQLVNGRLIAGTDKQPEREQLTLLTGKGELRNVDLSAATMVRFIDPKLQAQFKEYLAAMAAAQSSDKRSVYIDAAGAGVRQISASYIIPAAVWKSSYRLIFPETGAPTLEGWAMVDNTTGDDWTGVQLSLVSGRPISFVSQLYAPRYVQRPTAELPDDQAAQPMIHAAEFDLEMNKKTAVMAPPPPPPAAMAPRMYQSQMQSMPAPAPGAPHGGAIGGTASSLEATASAQELGDLFEYRIAEPVTIRKDESAMLPFLQQKIEARKLLIYSSGSGSIHPANAAELNNSTGKTLDGGPITVYDGGAYGGEALMETLKSGDKRLISYAVDLGTRITEAFDTSATVVREIHANRGTLVTKVAAEETRTYTARNVDQKDKTLIIEHPLRQDYVLLNQKPIAKTATSYRFEVKLAAGATEKFPVSEERVYSQTFWVSNLTPDVLVNYIGGKELSVAGRKQLQQISDHKARIAETEQDLRDATDKTQALTADETRIRQNIGSLNSVTGQQQLVQNYARQLDAAEQRLAALRDRQAELQGKKSTLESELSKMIEALSF
jgi:chaperonin cofactor prefoldin